MTLTAERLRELLNYDPITGIFTYRLQELGRRRGRRNPGKIAGSLNGYGYLQIGVDGRRYVAHQLAWLYMTGTFPGGDLDHRDGVRSHNAFKNLRPATRPQNQANAKTYCTNRLGLKGVSEIRTSGRFKATIVISGHHRHLGTFETAQLAHDAYLQAAKLHFGEFARSG